MQSPQWYSPPGGNQPKFEPVRDDAKELEPAGFGIRFVARVVDSIVHMANGLVAGLFAGVILGVLSALGAVSPGWETRMGQMSGLSFIAGALTSLMYEAFSEANGGATVGKAICGLRVVRDDGAPCTLGRAVGRNAAFYIDGLFFGLIAWSAMSKSLMKQRLGDQWAGTYVVHARSLATPRSPAVGILLGLALSCIFHVLTIVLLDR